MLTVNENSSYVYSIDSTALMVELKEDLRPLNTCESHMDSFKNLIIAGKRCV